MDEDSHGNCHSIANSPLQAALPPSSLPGPLTGAQTDSEGCSHCATRPTHIYPPIYWSESLY